MSNSSRYLYLMYLLANTTDYYSYSAHIEVISVINLMMAVTEPFVFVTWPHGQQSVAVNQVTTSMILTH